ncbi:MAG: PilN domain-containing protein [Planctomycetota bacterium]|nr:PilN domain-containing protein [Planctomycetota bacterium]
MLGMGREHKAIDRSFLPEDYLERRADRRTNLLALTLFCVVSAGVVGAFLVTNRQWRDVKRYQEAINVRYAQAAKDIEQLKQLEKQKEELLQKAELTTALIERVPRTILLADLVNRMPLDVTLLELELKSTKVVETPPAPDPRAAKKDEKKGKASRAAPAEKQAADAPVAPPRYQTKVVMVGVTRTHNSVARYVASLQQSGLLAGVELKFSEKTIIEENEMNRFRIEAEIRPDTDARRVEPARAARIALDAFGSQAHPTVAAPTEEKGDDQ